MKLSLVIATALVLVGCGTSETTDAPAGIVPKLVVSAVSPDYATSDVIVIGDNATSDNVVAEGFLKTAYPDDIAVDYFEGDIYRLGRFSFDIVTRYSWNVVTSRFQPESEYSVAGDDLDANPYDIAFESKTKAYLARYGSSDLWVINPSAETESEFLIETIDLAAYARSNDSNPDMTSIAIVGDKVFVVLQDLTSFAPVVDSSVLVLDRTTHDVIDTDAATDGIQTIDLGVKNATSISIGNDGLLYVEALGDAYAGGPDGLYNQRPFTNKFTGGVVTIDPADYDTELVVDDGEYGDETTAPYGTITNAAVADNGDIFFSGSATYGDDRLYVLELGETSATEISLGSNGYNISDVAERDGLVYVSVFAQFDGSESAGLKVIDVNSQEVTDFIPTTLNPTQIVVAE